MRERTHTVDLCVIGGGLAGVCAAIAAARRGMTVALMQDRPVLGGNASSEIRMWVCGAHGENNRETGIIEELELENYYRNPESNFYIWDSVSYEKVKAEANITLLLNCVCIGCEMDGSSVKSVRGVQLTNETAHTVYARYFTDCSGDGVLAPMTGAAVRMGREAASEFNEDIEPETADPFTMGMSILFQARETDGPKTFVPPPSAYRYDNDDAFKFRPHACYPVTNYWWIELGGDKDSIHDTESVKDELIKTAFGVWDHLKNRGDHGMDNWVLEWIGFLPGKRESRRYVGDYIMNQNDVAAGGRFADVVAYGGWTMDDHHPGGFLHKGPPNIFHPAPSPFGIPYRCLYSKNIDNLFFAGRNISVTHAALSATRVMGTCAVLGQAAGTAAALAAEKGVSPRRVYENHIEELRLRLMDDDCCLPYAKRRVGPLTAEAAVAGSGVGCESLTDGNDRPGASDGWLTKTGGGVTYGYREIKNIRGFRLVFDSDLNRGTRNMPCSYPLNAEARKVPGAMVKSFKIEASDDGKNFRDVYIETNNYQRLVNKALNASGKYFRLTVMDTWGNDMARVFSWDLV